MCQRVANRNPRVGYRMYLYPTLRVLLTPKTSEVESSNPGHKSANQAVHLLWKINGYLPPFEDDDDNAATERR